MQPGAVRSALLVEDDTATRDLLARHLVRAGIDVVAVASGEEALEQAPERYTSFDVVVLDVHLPGMSGLELASLIQARRPDQPIVLITGDSDPRLAREALSRGPVSYLLKPFEMHELLSAVEVSLSRALRVKPAARTEPRGWLDLVERSYMGSGHARRVGRIALVITESIPDTASRLEVGEMLVTAWSHELGRTDAQRDPVAVAVEGARILAELGSSRKVVEGVRHLAERFDGSGGPAGLAGDAIPLISQIVAVADAFEHFLMNNLTPGAVPSHVVETALAAIQAESGAAFRPEVVDAAKRQRPRLITICAETSALSESTATPRS